MPKKSKPASQRAMSQSQKVSQKVIVQIGDIARKMKRKRRTRKAMKTIEKLLDFPAPSSQLSSQPVVYNAPLPVFNPSGVLTNYQDAMSYGARSDRTLRLDAPNLKMLNPPSMNMAVPNPNAADLPRLLEPQQQQTPDLERQILDYFNQGQTSLAQEASRFEDSKKKALLIDEPGSVPAPENVLVQPDMNILVKPEFQKVQEEVLQPIDKPIKEEAASSSSSEVPKPKFKVIVSKYTAEEAVANLILDMKSYDDYNWSKVRKEIREFIPDMDTKQATQLRKRVMRLDNINYRDVLNIVEDIFVPESD